MAKALVLFSGGLDSILAAKILQSQGLETICVHFTSPFFGQPQSVEHWQKIMGLNIIQRDIGGKFVDMLVNGPAHGYGKNLNPCVDCKILLFSEAKAMLAELGADFLASGEVLGQRPMSQRRDTLNLIQNEAGISGMVVRPLSGKLLEESIPEKKGLVRRELFQHIAGRGRNTQLELAKTFQLREIPSPAGGCLLTEKENTRRYWRLLRGACLRPREDLLNDFRIIANGRALFHSHTGKWLVIGRNQSDNKRIRAAATPEDVLMSLPDFPSPVCLARSGSIWEPQLLRQAAEITSSYSPAAVKTGKEVKTRLASADKTIYIDVFPARNEMEWSVPGWDETHGELKEYRKNWLENKKSRKAKNENAD